MLPADYIFVAAVAIVVGCNLYAGPRIKRERVAMQWGFDGKPTWYAPKWAALWGMVPFMLSIRLFIWLASTYAPQNVHGAELGIVLFSVIVTGAHIFVLKMAERAHQSRCPKASRWSPSATPALYITKLPKAEHDAAERQAAMEALL
jgi:hypothetical protein